MDINRKVIGSRLSIYRKKLNMTQEFVSDYTDIKQSVLSSLERGESSGLDSLCTLLNFYSKYFDLYNFFSDDFSPVPVNERKESQGKEKFINEKLEEMKSRLDIIINLRKS